jgi:AAA15 family ATPase/GTPase
MLIDFTIQNYLSFKDKKTFSFLCNSRNVEDDKKLLSIDEGTYKLYTTSVILGPNASGKTNFLKALSDFKLFVTKSNNFEVGKKNPYYKPFKLNTDTINSPTIFDIEFVENNDHYSYIVEFDEDKVISETLYIFTKKKKLAKSLLFERKEQSVNYGNKFKGNKAVFNTVLLPNKLLLSIVGNSNNEILDSAYSFFSEGLNTDFPYQKNNILFSKYATALLAKKGLDLKDLTLEMLRAADLQINDIEYKKDEYKGTLELFSTEPYFKHNIYNNDYNKQNEVSFNLYDEESAGSNKLFELASIILLALISGSVLVIDELSSCFHPKIELFLVDLFLDKEININGAQLLFNTHNINIIDNNRFTREQVCFTDRNRYGESDLFCLDEFDKNLIRDYANYGKSYSDNRLGALPTPCFKSFKEAVRAFYAKEKKLNGE